MSERCPRCENARHGAVLAALIAKFNADAAQLNAQGIAHTCRVEPEPEPEPTAAPEAVPAPEAEAQRDFDWMG